MEVTADGAKRIGTPRTRHVLRGRWIDWDHDPRMPSWPGAPGLPRNAANRPNTCMYRPLATTEINLAKGGPSIHAVSVYTLPQSLSLTLFEKTPIFQIVAGDKNSSRASQISNQLNLFSL